MATLRAQLSLIIEDLFINQEQFAPNEFSFALSGDGLRRTITVADDGHTTLDTGEMTPKWWLFMNVDANNDLIIAFDALEVITLSPGEFSFLRSSQTPYAKGVGGASRLLYGVYS
jgi:hypothetical protein